ncbi:succinate dehydrogenase [ubiquinone] cytochrome b small subunit, mitochondrial-like [Centruroides sculpturatus]|uniref:succinate dehydrogenase [ubiquinone] cytochrome b small subunit, mitochondrial-like n=1 Tax=Centruroides sculpturatus TaxID=218467 RepID=UPI000C6D3226|nr:succinate dehydrogenase [ubiquinone] cytochrome b small subunit, mitochondrial-like [Centruroides sculpturatus]
MNSLFIFSRSCNRVNALYSIKRIGALDIHMKASAVPVLFSKIALPAPEKIDVKRISQTAVKCSEDHKGHDHSFMWTLERVVSLSLMGMMPAAFVFSHPIMDYLVSLALVAHVHWGIESVVVDYVRPRIFGSTIANVSLASVYFLSALSLGSLFYFNYSDVGLVNAIKMFFSL